MAYPFLNGYAIFYHFIGYYKDIHGMNKKYTLCFLLAILSLAPACAQIKSNRMIYGRVLNAVTRKPLNDVMVYLETPQGQAVDSILINDRRSMGSTFYVYWFDVPKEGGKYRLRVAPKGYETAFLDVDCKPFLGRESARFVGDILVRRKRVETQLGEATVTATKVKFYNKGDTVVYNADAFQLAEGSMLDALIKQLPGAELKDDGRILVNGKQVESLLLNGEDFFKGNNRIMLDNLPSYMVNQVKVYDKAGKLSEFAGRDMGDKEYVMDVRLKRQYSIGWIGNAEGGYGSKDRYLARLFALRFTPQSRLSAYVNMNNLNDTRDPGENTEWTPSKMPSGLQAVKSVGTDYLVKDRMGRYDAKGNVYYSHTGTDTYNRRAAEQYLPQANAWQRTESMTNSGYTYAATSHSFSYRGKDKAEQNNYYLSLNPSFSYSSWDNRVNNLSATFSEDPSLMFSVAGGLLDSIRNYNGGSALRGIMLNRYLAQSKQKGHSVNASFGIDQSVRVNRSGDFMALTLSAGYADRRDEIFSHDLYDYPATSGQPDFRNRWEKARPDRNFNYSAKLSYYMTLPNNMEFNYSYTFGQDIADKDYALNRLEALDGWGAGTDHGLGALPSTVDFTLRTTDTQNSYSQSQTNTWHQASVYHRWNGTDKRDNYWDYRITLPLRFVHYSLDYKRAAYDGNSTRNTVRFLPSVNVKVMWHNIQRQIQFIYSPSQSDPAMTDLLDIERTADPLNIYNGNPHLKKSYTHNLSLYYYNGSRRKQRSLNANVKYRIQQDATAWGYTYDRSTGVRHYSPDNVNGNYSITGSLNYNMPLDRKRRLTLNTASYVEYRHGVDLISTTDAAPSRSSVKVFWATETVTLDYRMSSRFNVGFKTRFEWDNARSKREGFSKTNDYIVNYGPTMKVELPWLLQLSTDLTMYTRRGYSSADADRDNLVWNARLSRRIPKANLTLMVDGYDILGQLSNYTHALNSQGRTETYRNVIPRYVMFHVIYRFNVKPKKRPGE